jgi:hypothetical protein
LEETKSRGFKVEYFHKVSGLVNNNTKSEAEHVLRVGEKVFGKEKVGKGELPFKAS